MTIRRREPDNDADEEDEGPISIDASSDDEGGRPVRRRQCNYGEGLDNERTLPLHPVHPAATDFGPRSLATFLKTQLGLESGEVPVDKGKGRAADSPTTLDNTLSGQPFDDDSGSDFYLSAEDSFPMEPSPKRRTRTKLTLVPNALDNLHNSSSGTSDGPQVCSPPLADNDSNLTAPDLPSSRRGQSKSKTTVAEASQHSNLTRILTRSSKRHAAHRANHGQSPQAPQESDDTPARHRKTTGQLSHLVPSRQPAPQIPVSIPSPALEQTESSTRNLWIRSSNMQDIFSSAHAPSLNETLSPFASRPIPIPSALPRRQIGSASPSRRAGRFRALRSPLSDAGSLQTTSDGLPLNVPFAARDGDSFDASIERAYQQVMAASEPVDPSKPTSTKKGRFNYASLVPSRVQNYQVQIPLPELSQPLPSPVGKITVKELPCPRPAPIASQFLKGIKERVGFKARGGRRQAQSKPAPAKTEAAKPRPIAKRDVQQYELPYPDFAIPAAETEATDSPRNSDSLADSETLRGINFDLWMSITDHLSFEDICRLRLVCKAFAHELAPILFRNVVTEFGKPLFGESMFSKYGKAIHKFGISFEYDQDGLAAAASKKTEKREQAWYGSYRWPVEKYPRFAQLQELEDLVDNNHPLLKNSLCHLTNVHELALSLDSGHGWLEGPDISDLALYELRRKKGTKIFGQTFDTEDVWHTYGRNEYFKWAQQNAINRSIADLPARMRTRSSFHDAQRNGRLRRMVVRDYDSFRDETSQHDFDPHSHTGGEALDGQNGLQQLQGLLNNAGPTGLGQQLIPQVPQHQPGLPLPQHHAQLLAAHRAALFPAAQRLRRGRTLPLAEKKKNVDSNPIPLQWPIIFSGHNVAAECCRGSSAYQPHIADAHNFGFVPGQLTEAQVQWLMETLWAQRAFLSAYTTAIITQKQALRQVHTLTLAKISSGLLPSLAQREFWTALAGLKRLKILVSPDWREEHIPGDNFFATSMPISPVTSASKFAAFLQNNITRIENLSHLTIGYVGGGEQAVGLFARNQHLLPAPITGDPRAWVTDHFKKPDRSTLFRFDHIRDLTFENCWFSPCMLETFMEKSQDTSLHTLTLDSVSMLSKHSTGIDGPLSTIRNGLRTKHEVNQWLHEEVPASACWTDVLDKITPGITMQERKYAAGMIDTEIHPIPTREFRGNIQKIILKSCGYAKIGGIRGESFNQNSLVMPVTPAHDHGLAIRRAKFERNAFSHSDLERAYGRRANSSDSDQVKDMRVMMSTHHPTTDAEWFGLGTLTQCVHPIEKRVLEQAWGLKFGWGDDITRWAAVEDGFYECGTGRFSGVIERDGYREETEAES